MARSDSLEELVRDLPPELHEEVEDFIRFLLLRRRGPIEESEEEAREPRFEWAGALSHLEDVSAVDLQHQALDEWSG